MYEYLKSMKARLIGQLRFTNPDLRQDLAFPHRCLSKWTLQELFTNVRMLN